MNLAVVVDNGEQEEPERRRLPLKGIVLDPDLQPREKIDPKTVDAYAEMLRDGVVMPPVVLVYDGEKFWLADGFHRIYGHREAGLADCEALIHYGSKLDAARIALRANAEHGRPRTESDIDRAYETALKFKLVDPADWQAVMALIACGSNKAKALTKSARDAQEAELRRRMFELRRQGLSFARIAAALREEGAAVAEETVRLFIKERLRFDPKDAPQNGRAAEIGDMQPDVSEPVVAHDPETGEVRSTSGAEGLSQPEQIDIEDVAPAADLDPVALYEETRRREAAQRELWGDVLQTLQGFNKLVEPETLFANRYRKFDHAIEPALNAAWNWMQDFEERWNAATAQDR